MKISVIIPVYNVEKYLKKCVDSVLAQDFSDYEILLIDDGSTDSSGKICDEYAEKNPIIKVIHQENKGLGGARNTGISSAQGEYLLFVDSDDAIKNNALLMLSKTAHETEADVVFFGADFIDENGVIISVLKPTEKDLVVVNFEERFLAYFRNTYTWNKFYRRSLFTENHIFFPERIWYEDLCTVSKIALFAKKTVCICDSVYEYLQRTDSIMHVKNTDRNIDMISSVQSVLEFYRKNNIFEENRDELCFLAVMHVMVLCTLRVSSEDTKHPLLKRFYDFTKENFADFETNKFVRSNLSKRHKLIFFFSRHRRYEFIRLLGNLNKIKAKFSHNT